MNTPRPNLTYRSLTRDYMQAVIQRDQEAQDRRLATADTIAELVFLACVAVVVFVLVRWL